MITLNIQIKLLVFSFIFGFFFSLLIEIFNKKTKKCKTVVKGMLSFLLVFLSTIIYFEGIEKIGYGIFHIYSILTIILGFVFYDVIANRLKK